MDVFDKSDKCNVCNLTYESDFLFDGLCQRCWKQKADKLAKEVDFHIMFHRATTRLDKALKEYRGEG